MSDVIIDLILIAIGASIGWICCRSWSTPRTELVPASKRQIRRAFRKQRADLREALRRQS